MVNITITPALWHATGSLKAEGHAMQGPVGEDLVCAGLTALMHGLAANLREIRGIQFRGDDRPGWLCMRWTRDNGSDGIHEANKAAWHFYRALDAMSKEYPDAVRVRWVSQQYYKGRKKRNETERRDHRSDKSASE